MLSCIFKTYIYLQYIIIPLRYHYILKSIWLKGKRNQCVDHLIHTLVMKFLPNLKICYRWQALGRKGLDLAEKCHKEILTHTSKTLLKRIQKSNNSHFDMQSSSSNKIYQVNLDTTSCNCSDFPHIQYAYANT